MSGHTSSPVFSALGGVGEGICGSSFIDRQSEGVDAVKAAVSIINGSTVSNVPVEAVRPECCVFDAQALSAHGIDPNATPDNAALIKEPAFSWRVLRPLIVPFIYLLVAILCIVAFGFIGFRRSMKSNREIIESRNNLQYRLYHDLLTDPLTGASSRIARRSGIFLVYSTTLLSLATARLICSLQLVLQTGKRT